MPTISQWWKYECELHEYVWDKFTWWRDLAIGGGLSVASVLIQVTTGLIAGKDALWWIGSIAIPIFGFIFLHVMWRVLLAPAVIYTRLQSKVGDLQAIQKDRYSKKEKHWALNEIMVEAANLREEAVATESELDDWEGRYRDWEKRTDKMFFDFGMYGEGTLFSSASAHGTIRHPMPIEGGVPFQVWVQHYDERLKKQLGVLAGIVKTLQ